MGPVPTSEPEDDADNHRASTRMYRSRCMWPMKIGAAVLFAAATLSTAVVLRGMDPSSVVAAPLTPPPSPPQSPQPPPHAPLGERATLLEEAVCSLRWRSTEEAGITTTYAESTAAFDAGASVAAPSYLNRTYGVRPRVGACRVTSAMNGEWRTHRIGPLVSVGGWDWWRVLGDDPNELGDVLRAANKDSLVDGTPRIGITAHFTALVDAAGQPLGDPPIHNHHIGLLSTNPGHDGRLEINAGLSIPAAGAELVVPRQGTLLNGDGGARAFAGTPCRDYAFCDTASPFVMLSFDDRQRSARPDGTEADDSMGSLFVDYAADDGSRRAKLLTHPLFLDAVLNDGRPKGSPPLAWYLQLTLHVVSDPAALAGVRPLSTHLFFFPSWDFAPSDDFAEYAVPADVDSLYWAAGRMPYGGRLVPELIHPHQHGPVHVELLFAATPTQLGLGRVRLRSVCEPLRAPAVCDVLHGELQAPDGAVAGQVAPKSRPEAVPCDGTAAALEAHIMRSLSVAVAVASAAADGAAGGSAAGSSAEPTPKLVCRHTPSMAHINGSMYGRAAKGRCEPWVFRAGAPFTHVSLHKPRARHAHESIEWPKVHSGFYTYIEADDGASHYTYQFLNFGSVNGNGVDDVAECVAKVESRQD